VKNYYVLSNGRVRRSANTLYIENKDGDKKPLPVEDVDSLYLFGEVDLNTRLLNFLSQKKIPLHVFNYYGFYSGSYYPREYLHSGFLLVHQVACYHDEKRRLHVARELVRASAHSLLRNLAYYERRKGRPGEARQDEAEPVGEIGLSSLSADTPSGVPTDATAEAAVDAHPLAPPDFAEHSDFAQPVEPVDDPNTTTAAAVLFGAEVSEVSQETPHAPESDEVPKLVPGVEALSAGTVASPTSHASLAWLRATIESLAALVDGQTDVNALRGVEGKIRERYYAAWRHIVSDDAWAFERRVRRPPDNEINALISFGNGFLYTVCLSEIYRTQLTPTVSYLHEPGARRFSLALDLSEIFKPLIVDRAIFRLLNTGQMKPNTHFDKSLDGCYLSEAGKNCSFPRLRSGWRPPSSTGVWAGTCRTGT
jgi:CRISPR/Cas system-associated endonuclease Cas1